MNFEKFDPNKNVKKVREELSRHEANPDLRKRLIREAEQRDWKKDDRPVATKKDLEEAKTLGALARLYRGHKFELGDGGSQLKREVEEKHAELLRNLKEEGELKPSESIEKAIDRFYAMITEDDREEYLLEAIRLAKNEKDEEYIFEQTPKDYREFISQAILEKKGI